MNVLPSWTRIAQCFLMHLWPIYLSWMIIVTAGAVVGVVYAQIVHRIARSLGTTFSLSDFTGFTFSHTVSWVIAALYFIPVIIYFAWLLCGWYRFILHLVRTGCSQYSFLFSAPASLLGPATVIALLCVPLIGFHLVLGITKHRWVVYALLFLFLMGTALILFAWYHVAEQQSLSRALAQSIRYAWRHPLFVSGWATTVFISVHYELIAHVFGYTFTPIMGNIARLLLYVPALFFEFAAAMLYTGSGCIATCHDAWKNF